MGGFSKLILEYQPMSYRTKHNQIKQGDIFNRLTVIEQSETKNYHLHWLCQCECGNTKIVKGHNLKNGHTKSCGCLNIERGTAHGMSAIAEYHVWNAMIQRCNNSNNNNYKNYGGRGISVCNRWLEIENFMADMGERPTSNHQIDRIDNNGNYEPNNCRWVTQSENMRNTRASKYWWIDGVRYDTSKQAAKELGVAESTINAWCDGYRHHPPRPNCYSELKY